MINQERVVKRTRRSAPRSKTGCLTCKIRRVKCDERKPFCRRCEVVGMKCDGYPDQKQVVSVQDQVFQFQPTLLPKPNIPAPLIPSVFKNKTEENCISLWRQSKLREAALQLDSGDWARLAIASCHIPSIRYALAAVGALCRAYLETIGHPIQHYVSNSHYVIAIRYYTKAIKKMSEDLANGSQELRTTLLTCLICLSFEAFNGNHALAVAQIRTGSELISEWRASLPDAPASNYPSPDPSKVEHELVQAFGGLTVQTFFNPDPRSLARREALKDEGTEIIRHMPSTFSSIKVARSYLELILRGVPDFQFATSVQIYSKGEQIANENWISSNAQNESSLISQIDELEREENLAKLRQWNQAFKSMRLSEEMKNSVTWLLLQVYYKTSYFAISSSSMGFDLMKYDAYHDAMLEIVTLSSRVWDEFSKFGSPFTPDLGIILPLYLVGMKCRFPDIRERIIKLMLGRFRREGIWDSMLVGKIVEYVRDVEERYVVGEGENRTVPRWARVEPVNTRFDLQERTAVVNCFQRMGPNDPLPRRMEAVLRW